MQKRGFTLIEVMGVFIITVVVALISVPIILNVIEQAEEAAYVDTAYGYVAAGRLFFTESVMNVDKKDAIEKKINLVNLVLIHGTKPERGKSFLYVTQEGETAIALKFKEKCYKKTLDTPYVTVFPYDPKECRLDIEGGVAEPPSVNFSALGAVMNEFGWYKKDFQIGILITDHTGLGIDSYQWCATEKESCEPSSLPIHSELGSVDVNQETSGFKVCVNAIDHTGTESGIICSSSYQLDKTNPTIHGLDDFIVYRHEPINLLEGITATDDRSGIEGSVSHTPNIVDTSKSGTYPVTYQVMDRAGNIGQSMRRIVVLADAPSMTFEPIGGPINEFGWAKDNFDVLLKAQDNSGHGIAYFKWCSTQNDICSPENGATVTNEIGSVSITVEGANHHICTIVVDNTGKQSEIICSEPYRLDKTTPSFSNLGDLYIQRGDAPDILKDVQASDLLSGINGVIRVSPTTIDTSKTGYQTIEYFIQDYALNEMKAIRNVFVIADPPGVTFTPIGNPFNEHNWAKSDFYIDLNVIDYSGHGIKEFYWCNTSSDVACNPSGGTKVVGNTAKVLISSESRTNQICVLATDGAKQSNKVCSPLYALDKTKPNLNGIGDINVSLGSAVDLTSGVTSQDSLSGVIGNYIYQPTSVNTASGGTSNITYTVTDYAGNIQTYLRRVNVLSNPPTVTFTSQAGAINSYGWARSNFLVTVNATDYSGKGMRQIVWCTSTSGTCTPSSTATGSSAGITISVESASNRICVNAIDNVGQSSGIRCSDTYKLDKTAPTGVGANYNRSNGTFYASTGSDGLSGYDRTTYRMNNVITSETNYTGPLYVNKAGYWIYYVTSYDRAGNAATDSTWMDVASPVCSNPVGNQCYKYTTAEKKYQCRDRTHTINYRVNPPECSYPDKYDLTSKTTTLYYYCTNGTVNSFGGGSEPEQSCRSGYAKTWKVASTTCPVGNGSYCRESGRVSCTRTYKGYCDGKIYYSALVYYTCGSSETLEGDRCRYTVSACSPGTYYQGLCYM